MATEPILISPAQRDAINSGMARLMEIRDLYMALSKSAKDILPVAGNDYEKGMLQAKADVYDDAVAKLNAVFWIVLPHFPTGRATWRK